MERVKKRRRHKKTERETKGAEKRKRGITRDDTPQGCGATDVGGL